MVTLLVLVTVLVIVGLATFALAQESDCPKVVRIIAEVYWVNILLSLAILKLAWGTGKLTLKTARWFYRVLRYFVFLLRKRDAAKSAPQQPATTATAK
jgi:hypothetical protein